jgi:hypothetical protein
VIPNRTWRGAAVGTVLAADLVVLLVAGAGLPGFIAVALGVLAVATVWGLAQPGGWGAFVLLLVQFLCVGIPGGVPETIRDWALAAASAAAILATHVALTMLATWPRRADLPRETARRWALQTASLLWAGIAAAAVGAVATLTPTGWAPWLGALALGLVAAVIWQVRGLTRRT